MSERMFLFIVGAFILAALYIEVDIFIYGLCLWLIFEAITDIRLTTLSQKFLHKTVPSGLTVFQTTQRFDFDAYRAWRLMVAMMLGGSFVLLNEYRFEILWFFPWFMGFAIMGAGVSGICPMILMIRWVGFR
jgi:hypothetical protein